MRALVMVYHLFLFFFNATVSELIFGVGAKYLLINFFREVIFFELFYLVFVLKLEKLFSVYAYVLEADRDDRVIKPTAVRIRLLV